MNKKIYAQELSVLSGIAILLVLCIHAAASALGAIFPEASGYKQASLFLRTFSNLVSPAVPIFIFISGYKYFLNDQETPYFIFLKKRLPRVLISFFIINTLFWVLDSIVWMEQFDPILLLKTYISSWLGNTVAYPLWYIPMYCCVIIACPLVNRLLHNCWLRAALYLVIGLGQRLLAGTFPFLGEYPFLFISYLLFFELGFIAGKTDLKSSLHHPILLAVGYAVVVVLFSVLEPAASASRLAKYVVYYIAGTLVYYGLSIAWQNNSLFLRLGALSYPLFLLHEPIIGRVTGLLLRRTGLKITWLYSGLWIVVVLCVTTILIYVLHYIHADRVLWNFTLKNNGGKHQ